jgi:RecJ-like exonuclease
VTPETVAERIAETCPRCGGKGVIFRSTKCPKCDGAGKLRLAEITEVVRAFARSLVADELWRHQRVRTALDRSEREAKTRLESMSPGASKP